MLLSSSQITIYILSFDAASLSLSTQLPYSFPPHRTQVLYTHRLPLYFFNGDMIWDLTAISSSSSSSSLVRSDHRLHLHLQLQWWGVSVWSACVAADSASVSASVNDVLALSGKDYGTSHVLGFLTNRRRCGSQRRCLFNVKLKKVQHVCD